MSPASHATFANNVGMLFMRRTESSAGRMCKSCLNVCFRKHQLRNLLLGWWGMISFFMTWYYLLANVVELINARRQIEQSERRMRVTGEADRADAETSLLAYDVTVRRRLEEGESSSAIAKDLVEITGVSPARAREFVDQLGQPTDTAPQGRGS